VQLVSTSQVQAAAGVYHYLSDVDSGGLFYGVTTLGSPRRALTLGLGYGYGDLGDSYGSNLVVLVGGNVALSRHFELVGEAYLHGAGLGLPDQTAMGGLRFQHRRFGADLGIVVPFYTGSGAGVPGPLLSLSWSF
jgi:hypothetical protein